VFAGQVVKISVSQTLALVFVGNEETIAIQNEIGIAAYAYLEKVSKITGKNKGKRLEGAHTG